MTGELRMLCRTQCKLPSPAGDRQPSLHLPLTGVTPPSH